MGLLLGRVLLNGMLGHLLTLFFHPRLVDKDYMEREENNEYSYIA